MPAWGGLDAAIESVIEEKRRREEEEKKRKAEEAARKALELQRAQERASQQEWATREQPVSKQFPTLRQLANPPRVEEPRYRLPSNLSQPDVGYQAPVAYGSDDDDDEPTIRPSVTPAPTRTTPTIQPYVADVPEIKPWQDWTGSKWARGRMLPTPPVDPAKILEEYEQRLQPTPHDPGNAYMGFEAQPEAQRVPTADILRPTFERSWFDRANQHPFPAGRQWWEYTPQQKERFKNVSDYFKQSPAYQEYEDDAAKVQSPATTYQQWYGQNPELPEWMQVASGVAGATVQTGTNAWDWYMRNIGAPSTTLITEPIPDVLEGLTGQRPAGTPRSTNASVADYAMPFLNLLTPTTDFRRRVIAANEGNANKPFDAFKVVRDSYLEELERYGDIRKQIAGMSPEDQQALEGTQLLGLSGSTAQQNAINGILSKPDQLLELRYQIDAAMAAGDLMKAAELGAQYEALENKTVWDFVDENRHWGSELVAGFALDPTNLYPGGIVADALQAARKARALGRFSISATQMADNIADGLKAAQPVLDSLAAGTGGASWLDDIAMAFKNGKPGEGLRQLSWLFAPTTQSQVQQDTGSLFRAAIQLFAPLTTKEDFVKVLDLWTNPQTVGDLVRGVSWLSSDLAGLMTANGPSVLKYGPGVLGNKALAQAYPIITRLREELLNMRSLQGELFAPQEALAEMGSLFFRGAQEFHGVTSSALPYGAAKVRAVRVDASTGVLEYLDKKGKILGTGAPAAWADTLSSANALNQTAQGGKIPLGKILNAPSQIQRMIMNDMFLGLRPDNWIKNALGATSMLVGTDTYTLLPNKSMLADLAKKFEGFAPTEGLFDLQTGVDVLGGDRNPNASSLIGKIPGLGKFMEGAYNIPYGASEIRLPGYAGNVALPFGEESFRTRAFYVTFMRTFNSLWTNTVNSRFGTGLQQLGIDPNLAKVFRDAAVEAGKSGNRRTFVQAVRDLASKNTVTPNLSSVGVPDELIPGDTRNALNGLLAQAGETPEAVEDLVRTAKRYYQNLRDQTAPVLATNTPPLGNASTSEQLAETVATITSTIQDAAKPARVNGRQATQAAKSAAQAVVNTTVNGLATLRRDIAARPSNPVLSDMLADFFFDFHELRKATLAKVDEAGRRAVQQGTPDGWAEKYYTTVESWSTYADELATLIDDYRGKMMDIALGRPYQAQRGTWDLLARFLNLEEGGLQTQIATELGRATPDTAPQFEATMGAGRDLIMRRTAILMEVFGKYPSADNFDLLEETLSKMDEFGAAASEKIQGMHAGQIGQDAYNMARNNINRQAVQDAANFIYNAAHTMAANGMEAAGKTSDEAVEAAVKKAEQTVVQAAPPAPTLPTQTPTQAPAPNQPVSPMAGILAQMKQQQQSTTAADKAMLGEMTRARNSAKSTFTYAVLPDGSRHIITDGFDSQIGEAVIGDNKGGTMILGFRDVQRIEDVDGNVLWERPKAGAQTPTPAPVAPTTGLREDEEWLSGSPVGRRVRTVFGDEGTVLGNASGNYKASGVGYRVRLDNGQETDVPSGSLHFLKKQTPTQTPTPAPAETLKASELPQALGAVGKAMGMEETWRQSVQATGQLADTERRGNTLINQIYERLVQEGRPRGQETLDTAIEIGKQANWEAKQAGAAYRAVTQAPAPPAATVPTLDDLYRLANDAGIATTDATGQVKIDDHLRRAINKDIGTNVTSLGQLSPAERGRAAEALRARAAKKNAQPPTDVVSGATDSTTMSGVVAPLPSWQKFRDLWRRGRRTGNGRTATTGDAAQHVINTLDAAERATIAFMRRIAQTPIHNTLTPQQRLRVIDLADEVAPLYDEMLAAATDAGQRFADFAMLNFNNRTNLDSMLAWILPYHYYWSRMPTRAMAIALQKPQMINFYNETKRAIEGRNEQEEVPQRLEGSVPVADTPYGELRYPAMRYLTSAIPGMMYFQPNPFVEPDQADENATAQWALNVMKYTPGLLPAYQYGAYTLLDQVAPRKDGRKWVDDFEMGDVAPLYRIYGEADKAMGGALPGQVPETGILGSGDQFNPYRDGRGSIIVGMREGADPYVIYYAQQVEYNKMHDLKPSTHIPAEYLKPAQELAAKGEQYAGQERLLTTGGGYFGAPLYLYSGEEDQWRKMQEVYASLGYDEQGNTAGSKEARRLYMDENPILGPVFSKGSLIPGEEGTTPGQNAQFNQKMDEQAASTAKLNAEREAYIAANPNVDSDTFEAWNSDWHNRRKAEKAAIEAKYPDAAIDSSDDPYKHMNPTELNEAARKNALAQAEKDTGTEPVFPEGGTKAQMQAYYDAKEIWDAGVEKRLNELLGDMAWLDKSVGGRLLGDPDAPVTPDRLTPRPPSLAPGGTRPTGTPAPAPAAPVGKYVAPLGTAPWEMTAADVLRENKERNYVPGEKELKDRFQAESDAAEAEYNQWKPYNDAFYALGKDYDAKRKYLQEHPEFEEYLRSDYKRKGYDIWWLEGGGGGGGSGSGRSSGRGGNRWGNNWDEYNGLQNNQEKAAYLRAHPEFARYYKENYSGEDWWTNYTGRSSYAGYSYTPRSYGGWGGGGGGGSSYEMEGSDGSADNPYVAPLRMDTPQIEGWRPLPEASMDWRQFLSLLGPQNVQMWRGRG